MKEKLINLIKKRGVIEASKLVGGYNNLVNLIHGVENITTTQMMRAIEEFVLDQDDEYLPLMDLSIDPIIIKDSDGELHQIEAILPNGVLIFAYGGYKLSVLIDEYFKKYERLEDDVIGELFDAVMILFDNER